MPRLSFSPPNLGYDGIICKPAPLTENYQVWQLLKNKRKYILLDEDPQPDVIFDSALTNCRKTLVLDALYQNWNAIVSVPQDRTIEGLPHYWRSKGSPPTDIDSYPFLRAKTAFAGPFFRLDIPASVQPVVNVELKNLFLDGVSQLTAPMIDDQCTEQATNHRMYYGLKLANLNFIRRPTWCVDLDSMQYLDVRDCFNLKLRVQNNRASNVPGNYRFKGGMFEDIDLVQVDATADANIKVVSFDGCQWVSAVEGLLLDGVWGAFVEDGCRFEMQSACAIHLQATNRVCKNISIDDSYISAANGAVNGIDIDGDNVFKVWVGDGVQFGSNNNVGNAVRINSTDHRIYVGKINADAWANEILVEAGKHAPTRVQAHSSSTVVGSVPTLHFEGELQVWRDTTNGKTYIIGRIGGTDYKVELT